MLRFLLFCSLVPSLASGWMVSDRATLPSPVGTQFERIRVEGDGGTVELHLFVFDPRKHTLAVADNPTGEQSLADAAMARGAVAGVNGGYFHPDRTPLGLVVSDGKTLHVQERARLLSGLVVAARGGLLLPRVAEYKAGGNTREALQAGPFLVDGGKPVAGLNAMRPAARTAVMMAGKRWAVATTGWVTLATAGAILATPELVPGARVSRALNLDGGSSTGMWVAGKEPYYRREAREVRNYLLVVPVK